VNRVCKGQVLFLFPKSRGNLLNIWTAHACVCCESRFALGSDDGKPCQVWHQDGGGRPVQRSCGPGL